MKILSKIAYHSTTQKGLKQFEDFTDEDKAFTGEGQMIHGWGLYLQSSKENNTIYYKNRFSYQVESDEDNQLSMYCTVNELKQMISFVESVNNLEVEEPEEEYIDDDEDGFYVTTYRMYINGEKCIATDSEDILGIGYYSIKARDWEVVPFEDFGNSLVFDLLYDIQDTVHITHVLDEAIKNLDPEYESPRNFTASQYEIEIPDSFVFMNEKDSLTENPIYNVLAFEFGWGEESYELAYQEAMKKLLEKYPKFVDDKSNNMDVFTKAAVRYFGMIETDIMVLNNNENAGINKNDFILDVRMLLNEYPVLKSGWEDAPKTNEDMYELLSKRLGSAQDASLWLLEHGIDGIEYEGGRDDLCYVIFNCKELKILKEE